MKSRASSEPAADSPQPYRGRFAPSPNGPLHFGSLIAALASWLDARHHGGQWLLRIDDIDTPRVVPGAIDRIRTQLEGFGLTWDACIHQSQRLSLYEAAFERLRQQSCTYPCICSRRVVFERHPQGLYDGHCRRHPPTHFPKPPAWRFSCLNTADTFDDLIQGPQSCNCRQTVGEFVLKRADGIWGYHFVCAVDEIELGITHVIRGADLLQASFAQRAVIRALNGTPPRYGHHPVAINGEGIKLSKRARAPAIDPSRASEQLWQALQFLGQRPPVDLRRASVDTLLTWAVEHYRRAAIAAKLQQHDDLTTA